MPLHHYDGTRKLKEFLDEVLRRGRHPGSFKIISHDRGYRLYYSSYTGPDLSTEETEQLVDQALFLFKSTDPDGYDIYINLIKGRNLI